MSSLSRGELLRRSGLVAAGGVLAPLAGATRAAGAEDAAAAADPALIPLTTNIPNLETPPEYLRTTITPNDVLYVRTHWVADLGKPTGSWSFRVQGLVEKTVEYGLDDLINLPKFEIEHVLQCSGNGRALSNPNVTGSQWRVGAAGNVVWGGVRVSDLIAGAGGLKPGVKYITGIGGEKVPDETIMPPVTRSVPVDAAMNLGLVAYEMNGELLAPYHGKPFRLILAGYYGVNNIKWLQTLSADAEIAQSPFTIDSYRIFIPGQPKSAAEQTWVQGVKSMIVYPVAATLSGKVAAGPIQIEGVAWSGTGPVTNVEVFIDDGRGWQPTQFTGPPTTYGWRKFLYQPALRPGTYKVMSRATDITGAQQPMQNTFNTKGYSNTSVLDHAVTLEVA